MPRVPLVPAAAAATVTSLRKAVSLSSFAAAFGLPAATPCAQFCFLAGGVGVCLPLPWRWSLLLSSGRGFLLRPLPRWTHTSRRVNNSSSSEDSSYRGNLPVLPAGAAAEGAAACSSHYYLVLTALLSSAALLTVGRDSRSRRRFPVACDAAAPGAATQHVQREGGYSPSAASTSSSALSGLQDVSPPCTRLAGSCSCSHVRRSSSSLSGGSSTWTRRSEGIGDRKGSSRSSSVRCKDVRSRCTHRSSSGMYGSCKSRGSAAALRRARVPARCAAAEGGVSWLPPAAGLCETSDLPAEAERRGRKGVVEEQQQEGRNASVPSSWAAASADSKTRQTGQQESTIFSASTARASSSVAGAAGADIRGDGGAGGQAAAVGETHRWSAAAGEEPQQHHHHDSPLWRSEENRPFEKKLEDALLFCGNSNQPLATAVADRLSTKLGKVAVKRFADGEVNIQFLDSLRGKDVYLIQPTSSPVNEHLMELLLMISTCRRASAKKITAVIPYYGYARQDRKLSSRVPISAADVARMIEAMGVDRVVAVDLHCGQIQGFFGPRVPVDNLEAQIIGLEYFQHKNLQKPVVVSPDAGGVYRARKFQEGLLARGYRDCGIAMLIKQRLRANEIERMDLVGSVEGSDVIIVDDMIDTAGTLCEAARELRAKGARRVFAFATHGLFSGPAINRIESSPLEEVVVTDSIQARREVLSCPRITSLSISVLLADAIRRIHQKESLNDLFMVKSWQ